MVEDDSDEHEIMEDVPPSSSRLGRGRGKGKEYFRRVRNMVRDGMSRLTRHGLQPVVRRLSRADVVK